MPDWDAIKTEYITTDISYRKLAEEWGVSFRTLADRAKREGWTGERDSHRNNVVAQTVQKIAARTSATNANRLLRLQEAADSMGEVIAGVFGDAAQFNRHIVDKEEQIYKKLDTRAIKDLTSAMKDLTYVLRNVYDLPTIQERLMLDKARADTGAGDDSETGVVELAAVLPEEPDNE